MTSITGHTTVKVTGTVTPTAIPWDSNVTNRKIRTRCTIVHTRVGEQQQTSLIKLGTLITSIVRGKTSKKQISTWPISPSTN